VKPSQALLLAGFIAAIVLALVILQEWSADKSDFQRISETQRQLDRMATRLGWKMELDRAEGRHEQSARALFDELMADPETGQDFLPPLREGRDLWGNPLRFEWTEDGHLRIWSIGPNGIDEERAGDDISATPILPPWK
jgi:hypothetical protein